MWTSCGAMCCRIILFLVYSTHVVFRIHIELLLDNLELCSTPVGEALWDHWLRASHRTGCLEDASNYTHGGREKPGACMAVPRGRRESGWLSADDAGWGRERAGRGDDIDSLGLGLCACCGLRRSAPTQPRGHCTSSLAHVHRHPFFLSAPHRSTRYIARGATEPGALLLGNTPNTLSRHLAQHVSVRRSECPFSNRSCARLYARPSPQSC